MHFATIAVAVLVVGCGATGGSTAPGSVASAGPAGSSPANPGGSAPTGSALAFGYKANLVKPGTLVVATSGTAPPVTSTDASGNLQGYAIDRCKAIADRLGLQIEYVVLPFASTLAGLIAGRYDMTCTGVPRSLAKPDFLMTDGTIQTAATVMKLASNADINAVADVKGKTIGGIQGADQPGLIQKYLNNDVTIKLYPGAPEEQLDLKNGRIAAYAGSLTSLIYQASKDSALKVADLVGINPSITAEAVRKEEPELLKAVNAIESDMRNSGELEALQKKWYGQSVLPPAPGEQSASPAPS